MTLKAFVNLKCFFIILMFWFFLHSLYIIYDGLNDKNQNADLAVVFGNKVNTDGSLSERLIARLDKSIYLYENNKIKKILVSGGLGKEGFWEGSKMQNYLESQNIPKDKIIVDNHGDNTEKTVTNSIKIADSLHYKKIVSVSQYYHQSRIKKLYKKHHHQIDSSSPFFFEIRDLYSIFREFFAFYFG